MIDVPCVVICEGCGARKDAFLRRNAITTGFMALMPGSPMEELRVAGETTTWTLNDVGHPFCSSECLRTFEAKRDKERAERAAKEKKR